MSNEVGFLAHGAQGYWLSGPLPSQECARRLAQFYAGINVNNIPQEVIDSLNRKWQVLGGFKALAESDPLHRKRVSWAVDLESLVPRSRDVNDALAFVAQMGVPIRANESGPFLANSPVEHWKGEDCAS